MPKTNLPDDQLLIGNPEFSRKLASVFTEHYAQPDEPESKAAPASVKRALPSGRLVSELQYKEWRRRGGRWPGE